jgi:uncharacterized protein
VGRRFTLLFHLRVVAFTIQKMLNTNHSYLFAFFYVRNPPFISWLLKDHLNYFNVQNMQLLYEQYRHGNILDVFRSNIHLYYKAFISTGSDLHDCCETLGRFLFGYFLLRIKLFDLVKTKKQVFKKVLFISIPVMTVYLLIRWLSLQDIININGIYWEPLIKIGIICTSCVYVSVLVLLFIAYEQSKLFSALQALGKMTLTNYLLISAISITLLYGIGFGQLGIISMHIMWVCAFVWLIFEIIFSAYWLNKFRYGPIEWIWRELTYRKRIPLRK